MGFFNDIGGFFGFGGNRGYQPLPYDYGTNRTVDNGRIATEFQNALGRAPSSSELEMYSKYLKSGDLEYGDLGQVLQGMPEASGSRLEGYADKFGQRLGANDQAYLGSALDQIAAKTNSQFASLGRPVTSAMGAQVFGQGGQIAQGLAQRRQSALADFYGRGLQNLQGLYEDQGSRALSRAYQTSDARTDYNRSLSGYGTQRSDASVDLYNANTAARRQALMGLMGGAAGAGLGAYYGGPAGSLGRAYGMATGGKIGSQAGGLF